MSNCVAFYNFGHKCITELLVATYSLRNVYSGDIVWMLANDEWNDLLASQVNGLNVIIKRFNLNTSVKRNIKSAIKPNLIRTLLEEYDQVLMCDGDLLFLKPIDKLFTLLDRKGILLTHFCNWVTSGNIMKSRINELKDFISQDELLNILDTHPAVNIGVMGFNKKGLNGLNKWEELTEKLAGKHIADEIAAHYLLLDTNTIIAPSFFNASAKLSDQETIQDNYIVHYHGSSQGGGEVEIRFENRRRASRLWFANLKKFYNCNMMPSAKEWQSFATGGIHDIISAHSNILKDCHDEFYGSNHSCRCCR